MKKHQYWTTIIGRELKNLRISSGFTSYENFAFENEISSSYYWKVENGQVNCSVGYLIKVLEFHNLDILSFFKIVDLSIRK